MWFQIHNWLAVFLLTMQVSNVPPVFFFFKEKSKPHWEENVSCSPVGCDVVLDWLRKTYWSRQLGNNLCEESEEEDEEEEQEEMEANTELDSDAWEVQTPQHEVCQKHEEFHGRWKTN